LKFAANRRFCSGTLNNEVPAMTIQDLLTESEYAALRGCSVRTVARDRALRIGPPFIRLGRKVYYRPAAIDEWLLTQEQAQPRASGTRK
jgi:hypothetical protein